MARLTTPYAEALYRTLDVDADLEQALQELQSVVKVFASEAELAAVLRHPRISPEEKKSLLTVLFREGLSERVLNFLYVLVDNGRIEALSEIVSEFREMAQERLGLVEVEVTSAAPLSDSQSERLTAALAQKLGRRVHLQVGVDPTLLGGLVISYEGARQDGSLRASLEKFRNILAKE